MILYLIKVLMRYIGCCVKKQKKGRPNTFHLKAAINTLTLTTANRVVRSTAKFKTQNMLNMFHRKNILKRKTCEQTPTASDRIVLIKPTFHCG